MYCKRCLKVRTRAQLTLELQKYQGSIYVYIAIARLLENALKHISSTYLVTLN